MTQYVDGFLLPIAADKIDLYQKIATKAGQVWMEHGALAYWETVGDDMKPHGATTLNEVATTFDKAAGTKENELVIFAWIVYPSREERDRILAAVMSDPRLQDNCDMPFDMGRMAHAGFKPLVVFNK